MRPSLNLESMSDSSPVESIMANLCASGREWFEVVGGTGAWRQDRLTNASATTGMPTSLPAGVVAQTVIPIMAAGTYVVAWDGAATVAVRLFGGGIFSGSTMSEYLSAPPGGPASIGGRFTFVHNGASRQANVDISDIGVNDPPTNLRVCRIEDEAGWQGLSSEFAARMAILRPECLRLLDIMEPNSTRDTLETWAQRRPDGWWTQSNVYLDVFTVPATSWTGTPPALGDTITWSGGSGPWVRTGSPVAGVLGHVKVSGAHLTSGIVTCTRTGATATLTAPMAAWMPRILGPSVKWMRDFAAAMMPMGLTTLWLTTYYGAVDDYHTQIATAFRDDARLAGLRLVPEFGNESWNSAGSFFVGYTYCNNQGIALGMPGPNPWEKGGQYYAHRQRQIHDLWRAVYVGREAEIVRLFAGQNAQGEYWFTWRTIINPDNDGAFPSWPREVLPIDAWATGPYIGHVDESPYNTAAWWNAASDQAILDYLVNDQLPKHVTAAPTGGAGFRSGGFRSHSVFAAERGCELWAYEANFHMYELQGSSAMTARVTLWMRTAYCSAAFQSLWNAIATYATGPVAWYNSSRQWGSSGWWGLLENPYDGTANDLRWQVLVTSGSGDTISATFAESDEHTWARSVRAVVIGPSNVTRSAVRSTEISAAASATAVILGPEVFVLRAVGSAESTHAEAAETAIIGDVGARAVGSVEISAAAQPTNAVVLPPVAIIVEASVENPSTEETSAAAAVATTDIIEAYAAGSAEVVSAAAVGTEVVPPDTGGRVVLNWVPVTIGTMPKPANVEILRGTILGIELSGPSRMVVPLVAPALFAGIATTHAKATEGYVEVSRRGTFDVDLEDARTPGDSVEVVAIDHQTIYSEVGAAAAGLEFARLGRGVVDGTGRCRCTYATPEFREDA